VKVHYGEGVTIHIGPKPCIAGREARGEASAGDRIGQPLSAVASVLRPFASQLAAVPPAVLVSSDQGYCLADH
jgi:hypothetical protein